MSGGGYRFMSKSIPDMALAWHGQFACVGHRGWPVLLPRWILPKDPAWKAPPHAHTGVQKRGRAGSLVHSFRCTALPDETCDGRPS